MKQAKGRVGPQGPRFPLRWPGRGFASRALLIFLATAAPQVAAEDHALSLLGVKDGTLELVVPPSGLTELRFHHPAADGPSFEVDVGTFQSGDERDLVASVALSASPEQEPGKLARLVFRENEHRAVLELHAPDLIPGVEYIGTLNATSPAGLWSWSVKLHRQKTHARLATNLKRRQLDIDWPGGDPPSFGLVLFERSGDLAIEGLTVRGLDAPEGTKTLDVEKHLRFYLDGQPVPDLARWPVTDVDQRSLRGIPPGGQRMLRIDVVDVPRGEYQVTLELGAVNADLETAPKVELVVRRRHSILWAFAVLTLAILLSFFITEGVRNWRQRLELDHDVWRLRHECPEELRALAPAVWVRATRKQTEMALVGSALLPFPAELPKQLETAIRLSTLLRRYHDLRDLLAKCSYPFMEKYRLGKQLKEIIHRIDPDKLDANEAAFDNELTAFGKAMASPLATYKALVGEALQKTRQAANLTPIGDILKIGGVSKEMQRTILDLEKKYIIEDLSENPTEEDLTRRDQFCACILALLNRYKRSDNEASQKRPVEELLKELLPLIAEKDPKKIPIERFFERIDKEVWRRVKVSMTDTRTHLVPSDNRPKSSPVEALDLTRFQIVFDQESLAEDFLVTRRMISDWDFQLTPRSWRWRCRRLFFSKVPLPRWSTRATGNTLVQFAPDAGTLDVKVKLRFNEDETKEVSASLRVNPSSRRRWWRLFAMEQKVLLGVSSAIALASGLVLYYQPNPSFGSLQDYLALFTWGVGIDQGKNLAQILQKLRKDPQNGP